jgi:hypothetical protein
MGFTRHTKGTVACRISLYDFYQVKHLCKYVLSQLEQIYSESPVTNDFYHSSFEELVTTFIQPQGAHVKIKNWWQRSCYGYVSTNN